jgi:hypothetical protein
VLQLVEQQHHQQYHHHANLLLIRPVNCSYFNVFVLRARVHNINTIATTTKIDSANNVGGADASAPDCGFVVGPVGEVTPGPGPRKGNPYSAHVDRAKTAL